MFSSLPKVSKFKWKLTQGGEISKKKSFYRIFISINYFKDNFYEAYFAIFNPIFISNSEIDLIWLFLGKTSLMFFFAKLQNAWINFKINSITNRLNLILRRDSSFSKFVRKTQFNFLSDKCQHYRVLSSFTEKIRKHLYRKNIKKCEIDNFQRY